MSGRIVQAGDIATAAHFVASAVSATGLTVTVDVWRLRSGSYTEIVSAASATEIGDGLYGYTIASASVAAGDEFRYVFKTAGTADVKHVAGEIRVESLYTATVAGYLDAAMTSRASSTAATDIQARLPAALVGGKMDSSVGAYASGQAPLQPTTAGRTLDVSAGGEAGLDWANIGSPTTTVNLSGTTIKAVTDGVTLATTAVSAIWDKLTSGITTSGSIGKWILDYLNAPVGTTPYTVTSPVATNGDIELIIGDDYANADGRALSFTVSGFSVTSATITFIIDDPNLTGGGNSFGCTVTSSTAFYCQLTDTQTATLNAGSFPYRVKIVLSGGNVITSHDGTVTIKLQPSANA